MHGIKGLKVSDTLQNQYTTHYSQYTTHYSQCTTHYRVNVTVNTLHITESMHYTLQSHIGIFFEIGM